jgi:hypothetical protein
MNWKKEIELIEKNELWRSDCKFWYEHPKEAFIAAGAAMIQAKAYEMYLNKTNENNSHDNSGI